MLLPIVSFPISSSFISLTSNFSPFPFQICYLSYFWWFNAQLFREREERRPFVEWWKLWAVVGDRKWGHALVSIQIPRAGLPVVDSQQINTGFKSIDMTLLFYYTTLDIIYHISIFSYFWNEMSSCHFIFMASNQISTLLTIYVGEICYWS